MPYSKYNPKHHSNLVLCSCTACESLKYVSWKVNQQHLQRDEMLASCCSHTSSYHNATTLTEHNVASYSEHLKSNNEDRTDRFLQTTDDEENRWLAIDDHEKKNSANSDDEYECLSESEEPQVLQETEERYTNINVCGSENLTKSYEDCLYNSEAAKLSLYEGSEFTVLETIAAMFDWFASHPNVSKSALSDMLTLQHSLLPNGNMLPSTYSAAEKFIEPFLLPIIIYHACPNDCILFRKTSRYDYSSLIQCPVCGASRYVGVNKQAARKFHYYPLGPRWRRMYGNSTISQLLQSHRAQEHAPEELLFMTDVQDSPNFRSCYEKDGVFEGDPRGMLVQLSCDGVNPFDDKTAQHSMWPVVLSMLNLPSSIRHLYSNLMLVGIIPANGHKEPRHVNPYLELLVDEVLDLTGVKLYDAYQKATFVFKVKLLNYVLDYPGLNKVFHSSGSGALQGCMWCHLRGVHFGTLDKTVYLGNRQFLPHDSALRKDSCNFPDKKCEERSAPEVYQQKELTAKHRAYDSAPSKAKKADIAKATGCQGQYSFMLLPDHNRPEEAFPDPMHTLKNCVKNIHDLITRRTDSTKVRKAEVELGRFGLSEPEKEEPPQSKRKRSAATSKDHAVVSKKKVHMKNVQQKLAPAPFVLSNDGIKKADIRAKAVEVPADFGWSPQPFFSKSSLMNSHDWIQVATAGILKFCLRGLLGERQQESLYKFFDAISDLCSDKQAVGNDDLQNNLNYACALMERDWPVSLQTISLHILHHLPKGVSAMGPVRSWSMFKYERFNSWICRRVTNRANPEATVIKTYQIFDWCNYMKLAGKIPHELLRAKNDEDQLHDGSNESAGSSMHQKKTCDADEILLQLLQLHYRMTHTEYNILLAEVSQDVEEPPSNITSDTFNAWMPTYRHLSEEEEILLKGISPEVNKFSLFRCSNAVWRGKESEMTLKTCSSVVCMPLAKVCVLENTILQGPYVVAKIQHFFEHKFGDKWSTFAYLHVFDNVRLHSSSQLHFVSTENFKVGLAQANELTLPLVSAIDEDNKSTLWILNFKPNSV